MIETRLLLAKCWKWGEETSIVRQVSSREVFQCQLQRLCTELTLEITSRPLPLTFQTKEKCQRKWAQRTFLFLLERKQSVRWAEENLEPAAVDYFPLLRFQISSLFLLLRKRGRASTEYIRLSANICAGEISLSVGKFPKLSH